MLSGAALAGFFSVNGAGESSFDGPGVLMTSSVGIESSFVNESEVSGGSLLGRSLRSRSFVFFLLLVLNPLKRFVNLNPERFSGCTSVGCDSDALDISGASLSITALFSSYGAWWSTSIFVRIGYSNFSLY